MQKYLQLFRVSIDQYFVYRVNFILWRLRVILNLILIYFIWNAVYLGERELAGYTQSQMLTYILMISLLSDMVLSSRIHEIGAEILNGDIINKLLKPVSITRYLMTKEVADKVINVGFAAAEISFLVLLLKPAIALPSSWIAVLVMPVQLMIGLTIAFFLSFSMSMIAFWTAEIWAPRFIYMILVFMLAGNYFPLDILPEPIYRILLLTPFPYFTFIPARTFLKGLSELWMIEFLISLVWIAVTYVFAKWLWRKGMREYSFYGR